MVPEQGNRENVFIESVSLWLQSEHGLNSDWNTLDAFGFVPDHVWQAEK